MLQHYDRDKAVICNKGVKWADSNSKNTVTYTFKHIIDGNENVVTLHTSDQLLFLQKSTGKKNLNGLKIIIPMVRSLFFLPDPSGAAAHD